MGRLGKTADRRGAFVPALAGMTIAASAVLVGPAGGQEADGGEAAPTVLVVIGAGGAEGDDLAIAGDGWGPSSTLQARVCGNGGEVPPLDCASLGPVFSSAADGSMVFEASLVNPPAPCPCVVHVRSVAGTGTVAEVRVPLDMVGVAEPEPEPEPEAAPVEADESDSGSDEAEADDVISELPLAVESVSVRGGGWRAWFGLGGERRLEIEVRNPNEFDVAGLAVGFDWGRGSELDNEVDVPLLGGIGAGDSVQLTRTFSVDAPAFGTYQLEGTVARGSSTTAFETSFTSWPWALFVLVGSLVLWPTARLVGRVASSRDRRETERPAPSPASGDEIERVVSESLSRHLTRRLDALEGAPTAEERNLIAQDVGVWVVGDVSTEVTLTKAQLEELAEQVVAEVMTALEDLSPGEPAASESGDLGV